MPAGRTSTNQPLDVSINGPIKSIGKRLIKEILINDPFSKLTLSDSINALLESKNKIDKQTIIESFEKACKIK